MAFRATFFHTLQGDLLFGWSLSFWHPTTQLAVVEAAADVLRNDLYNLTGNRVSIPRVRLSNIDEFRIIKIKRYPDQPFPETTDAIECDFVNTAFELVLTGANGRTVRQQIRGIKDKQIQDGGHYRPNGLPLTKLNQFLASLKSGGWGMRCLTQLIPKPSVEGISAAGIVQATGHGLGVGVKLVRLSRNGVLPIDFAINKIWKAKAVDANSFQLLEWTNPSGFLVYKLGTYSLQTYGFTAISAVEVTRATSHKTGRPTELGSGRRTTRARR